MTDAKCDTFIMILVTPTQNKLSIDRSNIVYPELLTLALVFSQLKVTSDDHGPPPISLQSWVSLRVKKEVAL